MGMDERDQALAVQNKWLILITLLAAAGLCVSGLLSYWGFMSSEFGMWRGFDCNLVMGSGWAKFLDAMPLAMLGMGAYIIVIMGLMLVGQAEGDRPRKLGWRMLMVMASGLGGASLWLIYLQLIELHSWCGWCVVHNVIGIWFCVWVHRTVPVGNKCDGMKRGVIWRSAILGLGLLGLVIWGAGFEPA